MGTFRILNNDERSADSESPANGVSRRSFLKILGASSAATVAGCADRVEQTIFPNVKGDNAAIPGVATWFRSTCNECASGCGIEVRVRDGRVVKVEGNPEHPVNRGGLCALGHSALQDHYDPDRIRQPLRKAAGKLEALHGGKAHSFEDLIAEVSQRLGSSGKKRFLVTGETSGALDELMNDFCRAFNIERVYYDMLQPAALAKASELTFGTNAVPTYRFDKAEVVVNFGADFVETWVSPCEYARQWADSRRTERPTRVVHVEPRLSLTGASADLWLAARPGSEIHMGLFLLKSALDAGRGSHLRDEVRARAVTLVQGVKADDVVAATGLEREKLALVASYLLEAKSSLIVAGGAAVATSDPLPLLVTVNLLNLVLGNVGTTVDLASARTTRSSVAGLRKMIDALQRDEVELVLIHGTNPVFTLPRAYGFEFALKRALMVVSLSSHLDETTALADIVLPTNSVFEGWGDSRAVPGIYSIVQPAMTPLWNTRPVGDLLMQIAAKAGEERVAGGAANFEGYLKSSWSKLHKSFGIGGDFEPFWRECVERGGYFAAASSLDRPKVNVNESAFALTFAAAAFHATAGAAGHGDAVNHGDAVSHGAHGAKAHEEDGVILYPFPSVRSFDGRAANRPWMLEIPDPISQTVWDAWAEVHPDTAKRFGIERGDFVAIGNFYGEINVPVQITPYVHRDIVAVPLGHGHTGYGRYATQVPGANVVHLLAGAASSDGASLPLVSTRVHLQRGRGKATLVNVMGSDSQHGRELARTSMIGAVAAAGEHGAAHADGHHHEPKQMYQQREHPLYRWGMAIDLNACTGCSACVVACYAENNIAIVGKTAQSKGREMSWLRIERYFDGSPEEFQVSFLPMLCQHCNNAPCEPVCPVFATYHNDEGLNAMVYNRCVGTRYCSNNCSYKVRRFNWHEYDLPEPLTLQLNPDVTKRIGGVMEKCTFCVQRIVEAKDHAKDEGRLVRDGEVQPACVQSCPTKALVFGNLNDPNSAVSVTAHDKRAYKVLDHHINTQPAISYLERLRYEA